MPEQTGYRVHDLAVGLKDLGHEVIIVTCLPSYPFGKIFNGYKFRIYQWEILDGVRILRLPFLMNRSKSVFLRLLSFIIFTLLSIFYVTLINWKPDVIWTNQIGYPGIFLRKIKKAVHIHEVQDMWPEWSRTTDLGISNWLYSILDNLQIKVYKSVSKITTISRGFKKWLINKGIDPEKIEIISNWADSKHYHPCSRDLVLGEKEKLTDRFNVMYLGNIGIAQGLEVVLDSAKELLSFPEIQFVFVGDGLDKKRLEEEVILHGLSNIKFLGKKNYENIAEYMAWADLLFLHLKKDPTFEITIPSKIYSYLASGKPILAGCEGDVAELISECNAGKIIPPENSLELSKAILSFYSKPLEYREKLGMNARKAFEKNFDRKILIKKYEEIFSFCVNERRKII